MKQQKTRRTRGQAALEFLSTYGFAFLIILVMIGALSYFGVLNPTNLLPDRCTVPTGLGCVDYRFDTSSDTLNVILRNNAGDRMTNLALNDGSSNLGTVTCSGSVTDLGNGMETGSSDLECNISGASIEPGDKVRIDFSGNYTLRGATWPRPFEGDVFVTAS